MWHLILKGSNRHNTNLHTGGFALQTHDANTQTQPAYPLPPILPATSSRQEQLNAASWTRDQL